MYIGASKSHAAQVIEETFLLCKPDAQKHHRQILQTVSDAGFLVLAKSFLITPALSEAIAGTFPSVRRSLHAERGVDELFSSADSATRPSRRAARDPPPDGAPAGGAGGGGGAGGAGGGGGAGGAGGWAGGGGGGGAAGMAPRHRTQVETHQGLMADILRLTRRHGEGDDGVNAGLPGADGDDDAERGEQKADGRVETAAVLKNTLLEAMSYEDLLREHVQHLAFGGTCLALQLSRQNAVERLIEIVGPENPIDARRVAPASIRARLGSDLIRNAVHAASNLAEASHCISAVFGYTTQYSAADIRTNTTVPESAGANLDERSAGGPRAVRPCSELVVVPLHNDHFSPLTTADLRLANVNAQAHLSYYTERPLRSPSAAESAEEKTAVHHHGAGEVGDESVSCAAQSWKRHAEDLEGELAAERLVLASHANLLRVRELDLLLREHELEDMTRGFLAAPEPVARGTQSLSGTALRSNGPAVVAAEDVTALLAKPVRLQALFFAVQQEATDGAVKHEDIIALYDRSPAVQLVGMDNHRERFQNYLYEHIQEPVSFDSFVATLMFLFKQ